MNILYLDSSTEACTAGVAAGERVVTELEVAPRGHAEKLMPMAEGLLEAVGLSFAELDLIGFGRGPGSFTGVRIATAMAQGVAIARDLPMLPVSSLECLAAGAWRRYRSTGGRGPVEIRAAIDARMGEIYRAGYLVDEAGVWREFLPEAVTSPNFPAGGGHRLIATGTGFGRYPELLDEPSLVVGEPEALPHALDALSLMARSGRDQWIAPDRAVPEYLRDNVAGPGR
ncbi:tRNA (adenosine(37)-N6)-threonylcarbamoyltransferase complex dimerization subunit type 1 TsaB [Guyparkeria sp. 1SP6A2]|nr:tRNA (adenosine(37)-N6)-threonylcarbamoyltransferase complex dimerization subunit type 1 TsaB [Guyparkeria sp. 1SP6A2]